MRREGRKEGGERDGKKEENKEDTQLNCHSEVGAANQERLDDGGQEGGGGLGPSGE